MSDEQLEESLEKAYWDFDDLKTGRNRHSERDSFKMALRTFIQPQFNDFKELSEDTVRAVLKGVRKIRDEITASDDPVPRWVPIELNALTHKFADDKGVPKKDTRLEQIRAVLCDARYAYDYSVTHALIKAILDGDNEAIARLG